MPNLYKGARYFDLFDDDLYKWFLSDKSDQFSDHLDNLRLQIMACLLFDGSIVVPEQWLVSSPTFCLVAAEIIEPWIELRDADRLVSDRPPIIPAFFQSNSICADEKLLIALERRLTNEGGSPIRLSKRLDTDSVDTVDLNSRSMLRKNISKLLSLTRSDRAQDYYLKKYLREGMADNKMADALFLIHKCLYRSWDDFVSFDQAEYNRILFSRINGVAISLEEDGLLRDCNPSRQGAWKAFFEIAEKDKIDLSHVSALRKILSGERFDVDDRRSIQSVGRSCMHSALAEVSGGEISSMSYVLYEGTKPDEFDRLLISGERARREAALVRRDDASQSISLDTLELLYRRGVRPNTEFGMDWRFVWKAFWEFKTSEEFAKDRKSIEARLRRVDATKSAWDRDRWESYQIESWDKLFERLSKHLRYVHFVRNPKDGNYVNIALRMVDSSKNINDNIKNIKQISDAAKYIYPAFCAPMLMLSAASVLVGTGGRALLKSDQAKAGFQLAAETFWGVTQINAK